MSFRRRLGLTVCFVFITAAALLWLVQNEFSPAQTTVKSGQSSTPGSLSASSTALLKKAPKKQATSAAPRINSEETWDFDLGGQGVTLTLALDEAIWNYPSATGSRGAGIRIGVVDDGLQTAHPDLAPNVDTTNDKDWNGADADPNPGTGDDHGTRLRRKCRSEGQQRHRSFRHRAGRHSRRHAPDSCGCHRCTGG